MSRYLETKFMDFLVAKYLMKSQMDGNTVWATDIGIFTTSAMLGVGIFVSNDHSEYHKQVKPSDIDIILLQIDFQAQPDEL